MPIISTFVGSKIAISVLALAALGGGGAAVAAAAGALPTPAHTAGSVQLVSPAPTDTEAPEAVADDAEGAVGPDVTGPAAFGLCTAYLAGGLAAGSTPSDALVALAGEDGVGDYCELIVASGPGKSGSDEHGKPAQVGPATPELPDQASQGAGHKPEERPGK